jgi:diguanylate cyclase (GGDEF)-like protein
LEVVTVSSLAAAMRELTQARFDALLLDLTADGEDGLESLRRLHEHDLDLPMIALIGDDDSIGLEALKAGAQDSLVKSEVDGNLLVRSVRYAIERNQLRTALRAMSLVDDLTGLYNRRGFLTLAAQQLKMADRMNRCIAAVFVDVDGLKWINDSFGHAEGDRTLVETANLLRAVFRDSDIIARIGGDEFVVLALEDTAPADELFRTRMRLAVARHNETRNEGYALALSTGVATYDPASPCGLDELMSRADRLMYAEKRAKRTTPLSVVAQASFDPD